MTDNFWNFETHIPAEEFILFEETVGDLVESLYWDDGVLKGMVHADNRKEIASRIEETLSWSPVEDIDWLEEDEKRLPPITVGKLFIYTPHYRGNVPVEKIPLLLCSSHAFGSGHHPTTEGCLEAIQQQDDVERALDIGCGSGILALAIEALFQAEVIGSEIDEKSAEIARENVNGRVQIVHTDEVENAQIAVKAPYDLIVSNIHSGPLCTMASSIVPLLSSRGVLILAGLLKEQQVEVESTYTSLGMKLKKVCGSDFNWPVLVFERTF